MPERYRPEPTTREKALQVVLGFAVVIIFSLICLGVLIVLLRVGLPGM